VNTPQAHTAWTELTRYPQTAQYFNIITQMHVNIQHVGQQKVYCSNCCSVDRIFYDGKPPNCARMFCLWTKRCERAYSQRFKRLRYLIKRTKSSRVLCIPSIHHSLSWCTLLLSTKVKAKHTRMHTFAKTRQSSTGFYKLNQHKQQKANCRRPARQSLRIKCA
jgi:hypothetical protein